jgi:hypothetical protein
MNKLYENEKKFEDLNAKLTKAATALSPSEFPKDFELDLYCECSNKACLERITIPHNEYAQSKKADMTFTICPDHFLPEFEEVVDRTPNYWVVVKKPEKLDKPFEV